MAPSPYDISCWCDIKHKTRGPSGHKSLTLVIYRYLLKAGHVPGEILVGIANRENPDQTASFNVMVKLFTLIDQAEVIKLFHAQLI